MNRYTHLPLLFALACTYPLCHADVQKTDTAAQTTEQTNVVTITSQEEFNKAIDEAVRRGDKSFAFTIDNKKWRTNAHSAVKRSTWYDHMGSYGVRVSDKAENAWELAMHLKDSSLMLQAHLDSKKLKELTTLQRSALTEVKRRVASLTHKGMSDEEKLRVIHDDLVNRVSYSIPAGGKCATIVLDNKGKCEAYSRYMFLALNIAGLETHIVLGNAHGPHAWNLVKVGSRWYHVDATWDDVDGQVLHDYFMLSDKQISEDHSWNRKIYPSADDTDNAYFRKRKLYYTSFRQYWAAVAQAYEDGAKSYEAMLKPLEKGENRFKRELEKFTAANPDVRIMHYSQSQNNPQIVTLTFLQDSKQTNTPVTPTEKKPERPTETEDSAQDWISKETWKDFSKDFDTETIIRQGQEILKEGTDKVKGLLESAGLDGIEF